MHHVKQLNSLIVKLNYLKFKNYSTKNCTRSNVLSLLFSNKTKLVFPFFKKNSFYASKLILFLLHVFLM